MEHSENANVIVALCSDLLLKRGMEPLEGGEWSMLAKRLHMNRLEPKDIPRLSRGDYGGMLGLEEFWYERVEALLTRLDSLQFEYERYARKNIDIVTRADRDYPSRLKEKLLAAAPPLLYFGGDIALAKTEGIAVTGSRKNDDAANDFALEAAVKAAKEGYTLYAGGADGTDNITEPAALRLGGKVVSYMAGSLEAKLSKPEVLEKVLAGKYLLLTPFRPEVLFCAENAPLRNKYIYASALAAFLVSADNGKGVAWEGAAECIRNNWVPVFVRRAENPRGNNELIKLGAHPVDDLSRHCFAGWIEERAQAPQKQQTTLFGLLD